MKKIFSYILGFMLLLGLSWGIVCCLLKLIAICFGVYISTSVATGIWLILLLLKLTFMSTNDKK